MSRNTISRITSRIDELTERRPPEPLTIVSAENADCARRQIEKLKAMGRTRFMINHVPRANTPICAACTCYMAAGRAAPQCEQVGGTPPRS